MRKGKAWGRCSCNSSNNISNGFLPNSLRIIGSCLKTVSTNATTVASTVKSAGASVAATISAASDDHKEQVTWAGFDKLELSSSVRKSVLLLGYQNGFQVLDVDDASNFSELVSRRDDGPVTFLQMQPFPFKSKSHEGFRKSSPLLLVVGGDDNNCSTQAQGWGHLSGLEKDKNAESHAGNSFRCSRVVQFYSLRSHGYVHALRFRSSVCMVRCSPCIIAVGLTTQIYCFDALTLENKFSVLTYPVPQVGQGKSGVNIGYGPLAVGSRWLAYASNDPLLVKTGRWSPQTLSPSLGVSPSASPASGTGLIAHYAMESGKHLAAGVANLGDRGYKTFSKYCHELLPESSNSSLSLSSASRAGRSAITETDAAGVVLVKDILSRAVICQFRAHRTPISALCFDPCGTLLVTASVYGNSINIFRIMPSHNHCGSDPECFDWSSSYVHLYKFHRGIRAVVIQDICFSRYSQWIAIVSSKGTCHVFVLSPFGGYVGFQNLNTQSEEITVAPVLTPPWWSTLQSALPPAPVTLSVATRIKDNNSGLLNAVSNAAASVSGKVSVPSGALAAAFHNSISCSAQQVQVAVKPMEHLLVYTPSGHVVQHEVQPSYGAESDGDSRPYSSSFMQTQDEELRINIHPVQWWDVCRRSNWPEREDYISETLVCKEQTPVASDYLISATYGADSYTAVARSYSTRVDQDRSQGYLSNAEVQYRKGWMPVWQNAKIVFCMTGSSRVDVGNGEFEIERLPVSHIEIRQKDVLPVFDYFHSMMSAWSDRGISAERHSNGLSLDSTHGNKDKVSEETIICHSKPASFTSTESSDGGASARMENLLDLDHLNYDQSCMPAYPNSNEYNCEKRMNTFGELSLLDSNLAAIMAEKQPSENKLPTDGVPDCEGALSYNKISYPNQLLGLHAFNNDVSQVCCSGDISAKVQNSAGIGMSIKNTSCKTLEPARCKNFIVNECNMELCNLDSENGNSEQNDENFHMFAFFEVDGTKMEPTVAQEVSEAANNPTLTGNSSSLVNLNREQDIIGALCDFRGESGERQEPAVCHKETEARINLRGSSSTCSGNNGLNQEEEDMESLFSLFDDDPKTLGQAPDQRSTDTVKTGAVCCSSDVGKNNMSKEVKEEEKDGMSEDEGIFALFEETMEQVGCLTRTVAASNPAVCNSLTSVEG